MNGNKPGLIRRFLRWAFGAPVSELPAAFGDTTPAELRVFEHDIAEAQEHARGEAVPAPPLPHGASKPARRDESADRQWE